MAALKVLKISRRWWGRGLEGGALRDSATGKQCCLGFACRAFGVPTEHLIGMGFPGDIEDERQTARLPKWLLDREVVGPIAETNDSEDISESEREKRVRAAFARHRVRVEFTR